MSTAPVRELSLLSSNWKQNFSILEKIVLGRRWWGTESSQPGPGLWVRCGGQMLSQL